MNNHIHVTQDHDKGEAMGEAVVPEGISPGDVLTVYWDGVEIKKAIVGDDGKPRWRKTFRRQRRSLTPPPSHRA
jgi:hypothetical protein